MQFDANRRRFLEFLAASPLMAQAQVDAVLNNPAQALNVMEFEAAARKVLPVAHWGYLATGTDDDFTVRQNREAYQLFQLRARRLVDVSKIDTSVTVLGEKWAYPLAISPVGNMKAFHPNAELEVAKAAKAKSALQMLSTVTTTPIEQVMKASWKPIWYQLYPTPKWEVTENLVKHAEAAGCPVMAVTVDSPSGTRNRETAERFARLDSRECSACHDKATPGAAFRRKPMFNGLNMAGVEIPNPALDWEFIARLRKITKMKILLKGIVAREDAALAVERGADGIIVSNHGGRSEDSGRGSVECLPEVVAAAGGRIPVLLDGGIRRGTDILKALALGATAVCIGRPYIWGLSAFGQAGVERVLELLQAELVSNMQQFGVRSLKEIHRGMVVRR